MHADVLQKLDAVALGGEDQVEPRGFFAAAVEI